MSPGTCTLRVVTTSDRGAERLVKSRQRVADHGEVFTPAWLVHDMIGLVEHEAQRIDSRFLEPACGSGNFLVPVLERKLATVRSRYGKAAFELRHQALLALMSIYGIELLADNAAECRERLLGVLVRFLEVDAGDEWAHAARAVLAVNIVQGDALSLTTAAGDDIAFAEWSYVGSGRFQRRDFHYKALTRRSEYQGTLFDAFEEHEVFAPIASHPPMTVRELAA